MRRYLPALALVLSLSSVTACGGDGSPSQERASEAGLSKAEFIAQGDAICDELAEESESVPAPTAEGETEKYLDSLLTLMTDTKDELAALDAPSDGEELQADMVEAYDTALEFMQSAKDAAGTGDLDAMGEMLDEMGKKAEEQEKDGKSVAERMADYGFESCGNDI